MADEAPKPPYATLAAVLAGGYATVTAVLTYLGVKDDALSRILREEPKAVLFFGALGALGIAMGVVAQQVTLPGQMRAIAVIITVGLMIVLFPPVADLARSVPVPDDENLWWIIAAVVVIAIVAIALVGSYSLNMNGVLIVVGGVIFALGAYGSIRLAVDSRGQYNVARITTAKVTYANGERPKVEIGASADGLLDCQYLQVEVNEQELATAAGGLDSKASVALELPASALPEPTHAGRHKVVARIKTRPPEKGPASKDKEEAHCPSREGRAATQTIQVAAPAAGPTLTATSDGTSAVLKLSLRDSAPGTTVQVLAVAHQPTPGGCEVALSASVPVGATGALDTELPVLFGTSTTAIEAVAAVVADGGQPPASPCDAPPMPSDAHVRLVLPRPSTSTSTSPSSTTSELVRPG